jgi:phosphoenolpyruvate synthase/pyruvate phosphate dikinase
LFIFKCSLCRYIEGIFKAMDGLPVTIRLLDPPLHEFLPDGELDEIVALLSADTGANENEVGLHKLNSVESS